MVVEEEVGGKEGDGERSCSFAYFVRKENV